MCIRDRAWAAANLGVPVVIHEMRPSVGTFAHRTGLFAEMVCSNSFRSDDHERNAVGLLHWEMRAAGGLVMEMAQAHRLPAGGALAVDRDPFAEAVTARLRAHPLISVAEGAVSYTHLDVYKRQVARDVTRPADAGHFPGPRAALCLG